MRQGARYLVPALSTDAGQNWPKVDFQPSIAPATSLLGSCDSNFQIKKRNPQTLDKKKISFACRERMLTCALVAAKHASRGANVQPGRAGRRPGDTFDTWSCDSRERLKRRSNFPRVGVLAAQGANSAPATCTPLSAPQRATDYRTVSQMDHFVVLTSFRGPAGRGTQF